MKKIISNEEIIKGAKSWLASFSNAEWCRKLEEENYLNELNEIQNFEWLSEGGYKIFNDLPNVECVEITSKDERRFTWTLSYNNTMLPYTPISYIEVFLEAA